MKLATILGMILIAIVSRWMPHPPNFTAMCSLAFFGAVAVGSLPRSIVTLFGAMFISDLVCGFHGVMFFVYLSLGLIACLGYYVRAKNPFFYLAISSLLFFIITNFGSWMVDGFYPKTWAGLWTCYVAALPFLANQVVGDLVYGALLYKYVSCRDKTSVVA